MSNEVGSAVIRTITVLFRVCWLGTGKQTCFSNALQMSENTENDPRRILKLQGVLCKSVFDLFVIEEVVKAELLEKWAHFNILNSLFRRVGNISVVSNRLFGKKYGGLHVTGTSVIQQTRRGKDGVAEQVK